MRRLGIQFCVVLWAAILGHSEEVRPDQIPEWAQQGKFRFTRLDGGPLEVRKTTRSAWGMHFNQQQKEVLANLYGKYGDRMVDLLAQAHVNWVWITWSVGFSDAEEAEQRAQCKLITEKLHRRGIKVAAYMCAVSIFWESMFRDHPRAVRWIKYDAEGTPFRYSGGKDPLRFIADLASPEWLEYQKRRVGGIIDAGLDSIFFDNTAGGAWNSRQDLESFFAALRRYIHDEKKSNIVLFTNYGLRPEGVVLNHNMEFVFNEGWREPGAWGEEWQASNIRRMKYVRGVIPPWKPLTSEYSIFRQGNRATTWLPPRSQKLGILEAAAFQSAYCWDMEGPFDGALIAGDPAAQAAWQAIAQANGFLKDHEDLYVGAQAVAPVAVLMSSEARVGAEHSFAWERDSSGIYDTLSRQSVLYDIRLLHALTEEQLLRYSVAIVPQATVLRPEDESMLQRFKQHGGKVGASGEDLASLAPDAPWLTVEGGGHVLGTVTRLDSAKRLVVHVLNYDQQPASEVRVRLRLGREFAGRRAAPKLFTPDAATAGLRGMKRAGGAVEFTLPTLDTYAVVMIE